MSDLLIPYSIAKKYLVSSGCRASNAAVERFRIYLKNIALEISNEAAIVVKDKKKKTIQIDDIDTAISILNCK